MSLVLCGCFFNFCARINFNFICTREGILKVAEIILGGICQNLIISNRFTVSLGLSYYSFLSTVSAGFFTSLILLISYLISRKTYLLVSQSFFEVIFNATVSFFYITSSCYLAFAIYTYLFPIYKILSIFETYPAINVVYILGLILGCIHAYDGWLSYKKQT